MKRVLRMSRPAGRGFTLVELLVAVTIGLLLTVVIAQLFLGSRQSFATTDDVSRMQENIRYSQQLLIRTVHLAGYKSKPNSVTNNIFLAATNPVIVGANNIAVAGMTPGTDVITVRYQGSGNGAGAADGTVLDCQGNRVDAGVISANTYAILPGANGQPGLFCSIVNVAPPGLPAANTFVELVPNVQNMQIVYGEDTDNPPNLVANALIRADQVTNWNNVVGVRIAILYQTPTDVSKSIIDAATTYDLNGATNGAVVGPFADRRIRRVVTTTMNLRNRTP
jgi:type IV pilus assembly protein PilW